MKLAVLLSIAALALGGYAAYATNRGVERERVERIEAKLDELSVLATRIENLEARVGIGMAPPRPLESVPLAAAPKASEGSAARASGSADASPASEPAVAEMSRRLAALEEKAKALEAAGSGARFRFGGKDGAMPFFGMGPKKVYGSSDDAQSDLELSGSQRADFDRAIADATRELDELRRTPDDEGKTWDQTVAESTKGIVDGSGKFDFGKIMAFRGKTIPGRNETFGGAEARIRSDAKRKMRETLSSDQQTKFDQAMIDPMLGRGMGPSAGISVFTSVDDAGVAGMSPK